MSVHVFTISVLTIVANIVMIGFSIAAMRKSDGAVLDSSAASEIVRAPIHEVKKPTLSQSELDTTVMYSVFATYRFVRVRVSSENDPNIVWLAPFISNIGESAKMAILDSLHFTILDVGYDTVDADRKIRDSLTRFERESTSAH